MSSLDIVLVVVAVLAIAISAACLLGFRRAAAELRVQRATLQGAYDVAGVDRLEDVVDALIGARQRVASIAALAPAVDELAERQQRVGAALRAQDGAIAEARNASGEADSSLSTANDAVTELARGVGDSSAAIEETVSSIRLVSGNIGGLADTVNSVSSAIGELAVSITQVAGSAREASTLSLEADRKAKDGGVAVQRLVESTREIANDIGSVVKKMQELGSASERIGNIVEVIDAIADQTNLLALNAAIEAARAGEHGRGFAVVADEVRKLAENSAQSTREIGKLVKDIQVKTDEVVKSTTASGAKAENGLQMADVAGRAIADISGAVAEANRLIEQISMAAREQAAGSSAIVNSVEQMNTLMREAARSLEEQNVSNGQIVTTIAQMQQLTDTVHAAVARQRAAYERIAEAARALTSAGAASRDAASGIDDVAQALRVRVAAIAGDGAALAPASDIARLTGRR
ncbi:MAG: methyl-accepting chemotaxis sensory transducer [Candidatus Eremiobacteraeota bacterium]|nr:methyl-accepting chemotaxis sensory transducer [Candidatus Eremiobacteraeota bacterium]